MKKARVRGIWLDYAKTARDRGLLTNLSAVAVAGDYLWTASDEGRTIECLAPHRGGYRLHRQLSLDALFKHLPGRKAGDEADIESLDVIDGMLWVSGSHCRVRRQLKKTGSGKVDARLRARPSRKLLGVACLTADGGDIDGAGEALPYTGRGSLRRVLVRNRYIAPFDQLPSKENGIDVEGMAVFKRRLLIGMRGPLVDSIALVADLVIAPGLAIKGGRAPLHFLDLDGLGVRDLTRWGRDVAILAGPVTGADGPFRIYRWRPKRTERVQTPKNVFEWPASAEHPEGICAMRRGSRGGFLVLYDSPDAKSRIRGSRYRADWIVPG